MNESGPGPVIEADGVTRRYGDRVVVDRLDLRAAAGEVHALLGPNGSGKTTTVRMMSTLLRPDSGTVRILGLDVRRDGAEVRRRIALVGQFHALDSRLTGAENLTMLGRLHGLAKSAAVARTAALLQRYGLAEAGRRAVSTYSGGMRRRLDLLGGLVVRPAVLFLDEPTTGLDPRSRDDIYQQVQEYVADGTTVILTTQYLDEADRLADRLTILDRGTTVAVGTPAEIKRVVGEGLDLVVADPARAAEAAELVAALGARPAGINPVEGEGSARLTFTLDRGRFSLSDALRVLDEARIAIDDIGRRRVSLDEAFLALTGADRTEVSP